MAKAKKKGLLDKVFNNQEVKVDNDLDDTEDFETEEELQDALTEAEVEDDDDDLDGNNDDKETSEDSDNEIEEEIVSDKEIKALLFINEKLNIYKPELIEVEDEEGNVTEQVDYENLVRQLVDSRIDLVAKYFRSKMVNPTGKMFGYKGGIDYIVERLPKED